MVPLETVVQLRETTAPQVISHFNMFRSAEITGSGAPGVSSGQAIAEMERLARETLPPGFDFAWAGQSLEEIKAGGQAGYIFALSILIVYLVLAAQYESWVLPLIILLGVPLAVFGALSAQLIRGFANDVFCQVGLVMLVGLAAKNSILIVEFAEQLRERGMSIIEAAIEAARIRLRPILMTSFAFILGVLPLAFATGAGAAARNPSGPPWPAGWSPRPFCRSCSFPCSTSSSARSCPGARAARGGRDARRARRMHRRTRVSCTGARRGLHVHCGSCLLDARRQPPEQRHVRRGGPARHREEPDRGRGRASDSARRGPAAAGADGVLAHDRRQRHDHGPRRRARLRRVRHPASHAVVRRRSLCRIPCWPRRAGRQRRRPRIRCAWRA